MLSSAADVFALMIENAKLSHRALEQEKLRRDLALAGEVQRRLLPPRPPRNGVATLAAFSLPARTVGGDYYDFIDLPDEGIGLAVADVSGKGIAAALLMSVVQASLRAISAENNVPPSGLTARMNGFLYRSTGTSKYATFFYAVIEAHGRRMRYVNAGHNPPYLLRRASGGVDVTELTAGGTVLGMFPEVDYEEAAVDLSPGDLLVAFTDGVTEALNPAGEEFGEERLKDLLRGAIGVPAETVSATLAERMRDWIRYRRAARRPDVRRGRLELNSRGDRLELQRDAVDAVTQPRRLRAIVEDVSKVAAAAPAVDRLADHAERRVPRRADGLLQRRPEARPSRAGLELGRRGKHVERAARARVGATAFLVQQFAREWPLGRFPPQNLILGRRQELSPFRVGVCDFERLIRRRLE